MFAGNLPSAKKRQPAISSSLLILMRAEASLTAILFFERLSRCNTTIQLSLQQVN